MFLPVFLPPTKEEVHVLLVFVCLSVCLSVRKITPKSVHGFGWNVACRHVGIWTNWLTFEPDPDYSPDAGTGLHSVVYKCCYAKFYVGKIPCIRIGGRVLQRGEVFKWFYSLSRRITFAGGTCALPSALLFNTIRILISVMSYTSRGCVLRVKTTAFWFIVASWTRYPLLFSFCFSSFSSLMFVYHRIILSCCLAYI